MGRAIGIDLGTSNIVVSYYDKKGKLKNFKFQGEITHPSALYLESKNEFKVGESALKLGIIKPGALITNYKYNIGEGKKQRYEAANGDKVMLNSVMITSTVLTEVLKLVTKKIMKEFPGEDIDQAVITIPAKFNPTQKKNTKLAAEKAGLANVRLAKESTAAAIAYANQTEDDPKKILVYDFGGGTFDVSIIEKSSTGGYREIATPQGDRHLGGNTITKKIAEYIMDEIEEELPLEMPRDRDEFDSDDYDFEYTEEIYLDNYSEVYRLAEKIKKDFSESDQIEETLYLKIPGENGVKNETFTMKMDVEKFNELIEEEIDRTIKIVEDAIKDSGENKDDLRVILTGGSSLLKTVQIKLEDYFDRDIEVYRPATLISEGAAIITENINGIQVDSRLPNDIGIKVINFNQAMFEPLLHADTLESKAKVTKDFTLQSDNQRFLNVQIFERDVKNYPNAQKTTDDGCMEIENIKIDLPANLSKSNTIVRMIMEIDEEGTLKIDVKLYDKAGKLLLDESLNIEKEEIFE